MHKLHVELRFDIDVQEVVAIAEVAAQAILRVYHAEASGGALVARL